MSFLWALVVPVFKPVLKYIVPWAWPALQGLGGIFSWWRPIAVIGGGVFLWWAASAVLARPDPEQKVSVARVKAANLQAELDALRRASKEREEALRQRNRELTTERDSLAQLLDQQQDIRNESLNQNPSLGTVPALPADDPWLRSKAKRAR